MRYRLLGSSGLRVSEFALGTMTFGQNGWGAERDETTRIFEHYAVAGGNFVDTADFYGMGESERWVAELIRQVQAGSSYLSSEDPRVFFGLGSATSVRRLVIRYPGGRTARRSGVAANQILKMGY